MKTNTEHVGVSADLTALNGTISGSRGAMVGGHHKQAVALDNPEPYLHFTGATVEYAKYLFNTKVGAEGVIMTYKDARGVDRPAIIRRRGGGNSDKTLSWLIFYRRTDNDGGSPIIDAIEVETYTKHDNVFSSTLTPTDKLLNARSGTVLEEDEDLNTLSSLVDGEFCNGVNLTTITINHPCVIEDSYNISQEGADKMHAYGYKLIRHALREDEVFLYLYGTPEQPRFFPEVGESIRNDGKVLGVRKVDPMFAAINTSATDLSRVNTYYDNVYHVDADPKLVADPTNVNAGSKVIDLRVWRNEARAGRISTPENNADILEPYVAALKRYYGEIVEFYLAQFNMYGKEPNYSAEAIRIICEALASEAGTYKKEFARAKAKGAADIRSVERMYQYSAISHYTVEIVVRYPIPVTVSSKVTDTSGAKGIMGECPPRSEMPYGADDGTVVDCIRSANAVVRRSTYAGVYHIYWDAASIQIRNRMKELRDAGDNQSAWDLLIDYSARYNFDWANVLISVHDTPEKKIKLMDEINHIGIRIWLPHELDTTPIDITNNLKEYAPKKQKLWLRNYSGKWELTKDSFYIGSLYTLRLDKTGREFSSTSSMRISHLGMVSVAHPNEKDSRPVKDKVVKWGGEGERRVTSHAGELFDEVHDRSNNAPVHRVIVRGLYDTATPASPPPLVDRNKYPLGNSRAHEIIKHTMFCEGLKLVKPKKE